jgi:hypothetical protein
MRAPFYNADVKNAAFLKRFPQPVQPAFRHLEFIRAVWHPPKPKLPPILIVAPMAGIQHLDRIQYLCQLAFLIFYN